MAENITGSWSIVKFIHDNTIEAVPTRWLKEDFCWWPKYDAQKLNRAIKNCDPPLPTWDKYEINGLRNATYDEYGKARTKCKIAEETSDLNSGDEKRKRRSTAKPSSCEESSDDSEISSHHKEKAVMPHFKLRNCKGMNGTEKTIEGSQAKIISGSSSFTSELGQQKTCVTDDKLGQQILRKLSMIELLITDMKIELKNLKNNQIFETFDDPWINFNLPISSNEELETFEQFLNENMEISIKQLVKLGGNTAEEFIKRAMKKLLVNEIQTQYSFLGQKQKKKFSELKLCLLIKNSTFKLIGISGQCTEKKIEDCLKTFLKRAPERLKHEKKN